MREFFLNVTRYPRYLVAFTLGVMNSVAEPLARRRSRTPANYDGGNSIKLKGALVTVLLGSNTFSKGASRSLGRK